MNPGYVYLIECNGDYKIGRTLDLMTRLATLQTGNAKEQSIIWSIECEDYIKVEKYLHKKFAYKRIRGEWFKLDKYDLEWIYDFEEEFMGQLRIGKI